MACSHTFFNPFFPGMLKSKTLHPTDVCVWWHTPLIPSEAEAGGSLRVQRQRVLRIEFQDYLGRFCLKKRKKKLTHLILLRREHFEKQ